MALKTNIAANYASQLYTTLIGILLVPLYLQYLGAEAYGLVGFFALLQTWFNLLDIGLTPTIARETARFQGGALSAIAFRRLHRALSVIFLCVALIGSVALLLAAEPITQRWLNIQNLNPSVALLAVEIMAVSVALRWLGGLYRGVISGSERLVWLSGFNAGVATLRFVGVFASMAVWGATPTVFFLHQLVVAALEVVGLFLKCHTLLPSMRSETELIGWHFASVRPLLRFAVGIAFTSSVWVLLTQTDKLILSGILPLADYGYFTLAVLAASGINLLTGPISVALLPRLTRLHAEGAHAEIRRLYSQSAQFVSVIVSAMTVTMVACAEPLLYAWTGSREVTAAAAPILQLYAIGNGLLALGAFPYYLQYARGNLRYHILGNLLMVVLLVPAIIVAARMAGGIGAGWVWVTLNALYLFVWVAYVHSRLEPGLHWEWIGNSFFRIFTPVIGAAFMLSQAGIHTYTRTKSLAMIVIFAILCIAVAIFFCKPIRNHFSRYLKSARAR